MASGCRREDLSELVCFRDPAARLVCGTCGRHHDAFGDPRPDPTPEEFAAIQAHAVAWWASYGVDIMSYPKAPYGPRCTGAPADA